MGKSNRKKDKRVEDCSLELMNELKEMKANTSGRKRSLYKNDNGSEEFVSDIQYDAEKEIQELREEEKIKAAKQKDEKSNSVNIFSNMSIEEMENHYSHCIKLCSDNKVNTKNAFKLQLIDYMKLILSKKLIETDNLPLMSCTLDASAKIYSFRVDKVYTDMVNIISKKALGKDLKDGDGKKNKRGHEKRRDKDRESSDENNSDFEEEFLGKWDRILGPIENFNRGSIEPENYNQSLPECLEYFNELSLCGGDFHLSWNQPIIDLQEYKPSEQFININNQQPENFLFEDFGKSIERYNQLSEKYTIEGEEEIIPGSSKQNSFTYFPQAEINSQLDLDEEPDKNKMSSSLPNDDNDGGLEFEDIFDDPNEEMPPPLPPHSSDVPSTSTSPLSPSKVTEIKETKTQEEENSQNLNNESNKLKKKNRLSIKILTNLVTSTSSDYSFFDESKFAFWKKPDKWQLKKSRLGDKNLNKNTKIKNKKKLFTFENGDTQEQMKKLLVKDTKSLSEKTVKEWHENRHTSPLEMFNAKEEIICCFKYKLSILKRGFDNKGNSSISVDLDTSMKFSPEDFLVREEEEVEDAWGDDGSHHNSDEELGERDHWEEENGGLVENGPLNSMDLASSDNLQEGDNLMDPVQFPTSSSLEGESSDQMNVSLLPIPYKVNKIQINYAKRQRRIDIKLIKETMWGSIENNKDKSIILEDDPEVIIEEVATQSKKQKKKKDSVSKRGIKFSEVLTEVNETLPKETSNELSFAIAVMSLLHLANEKNLSLHGSKNYDEIFIELET